MVRGEKIQLKTSSQAASWHIADTGSWDSRKLLTYAPDGASKSQKQLSAQEGLALKEASGEEEEEWRFIDATDFEVTQVAPCNDVT